VAVARALHSTPGRTLTLNVGRGEGVSVREVIDQINALTGYDRPPTVTPRRPGDPARVVASATRISTELGWQAKYDLPDMITSSWQGWLRLHPEAARS
jgi:UDP-glucose 4-epimerase